jgi:hypothetical protein
MRPCALDSVHHAAALEELVEADSAENFLGAFFEEPGEKVARKKNYEGADQRWNVLIELGETLLKPLAETQCAVAHDLPCVRCRK